MIAHPPCTHLAVSGAAFFKAKAADGRQQQGVDFFMEFTKLQVPRVCIENPVGIMSTRWRKPDQIIQPYEYGHPESNRTCLWLKGAPKARAYSSRTDRVEEKPRRLRLPRWQTWEPGIVGPLQSGGVGPYTLGEPDAKRPEPLGALDGSR